MTKQQKEMIVLATVAAIAIAVWYFYTLKLAAPTGTAVAAKKYVPMSVENSGIHWDRLQASRRVEYKPTGRDITSTIAPPPPEDPNKPKPPVVPPGPVVPVEPPAPVLPVKFFGYGTVPVGTARRAFFTDGEDVFISAEGETLQGRFRILHIGDRSVEFEELGSGRRGTAPIEEQVPSA